MAKSVGSIAIDLTARTGQFSKGIADAQQKIHGFGLNAKKVAGVVVGAFAAIGAASGLQAIISRITEANSLIDRLGKSAQAIGTTTRELESLRYAADLSGVATDAFDTSMRTMVRVLGQAAAGTGEAKAALDAMGISAEKLSKLDPGKQFRTLAQALSQVTNHSERARLSAALFGEQGQQLIPLLDQGSAGIARMQREFSGLAAGIDQVDYEKVAAANDAVARLKVSIGSIAQTLAVSVAPTIERVAGTITDIVGQINGVSVFWRTLWVGIADTALSAMQAIVKANADVLTSLSANPLFGAAFGRMGKGARNVVADLQEARERLDESISEHVGSQIPIRVGPGMYRPETPDVRSPVADDDAAAVRPDSDSERKVIEAIDHAAERQAALLRQLIDQLERLQVSGIYGEGPRLLSQIREAVARMPGQFQRGVAGRA